MARPSNNDLLAERKAIETLLSHYPGPSNEERVQQLLGSHRSYVEEITKLRAAPQVAAIDPLPTVAGEEPKIPDVIVEHKPLGVAVDTAFYPEPGKAAPVVAAPAMDPMLGDLTPSWVRGMLATEGPAAIRAKYENRLHLLPADVQAAIR